MFSYPRLANQTFRSLSVHGYRLYFAGQAVSLCGTWMQVVAQSWLVLSLTGSATALGLVASLQFLPSLLFAPLFGVTVDRFPKRRILYLTQSASALLAVLLGALVSLGSIRAWMVYLIAFALGLVNALDSPARQAFASELVDPELLPNEIALNSAEISLARVVGPALGGIVIASLGLAACFYLNGISFIAVLFVLARMRRSEIHQSRRPARSAGQLIQGLRYALVSPPVRTVLVMVAVVGTFTIEFTTSLPIMAQRVFHGDAGTYALLTSWLGVGALLGSFYMAREGKAPMRTVASACLFLGASMLLMAGSGSLSVALVLAGAVGFFSTVFVSMANAILQLTVKPSMRGRVLSLWTVAYLGSTVLGGPLIGWVSQASGGRWGLAVGGIAALAASVYGHIRNFRLPPPDAAR